MPRVRLTEITLRNLKTPEKGQITYTCDMLPGFGVRVSQAGSKTYVLVHGKRRERVTIGRVGVISLGTARDKAREILAHRTLHGDTPTPLTFSDALTLFFKTHCKQHNRPSTAKETERLLNRHFLPRLKDKALGDITTPELTAIIDKLLTTPSEANHAFTAARTLFRWATRRRYIPHSPLEGLRLPTKAQSRARVLSDDELRKVWLTASQKGQYGTLIQLLILTGQRVGQIANLRREFIKDDTITWPANLMKSGKAHSIPLTPKVQAIIDTLPQKGLLFPTEGNPSVPFNNWSNSHTDFLEACKVEHFTRHDLRRTFSTVLARCGVFPHITAVLMAHSHLSAVQAIYNRYQYEQEARAALLKLEEYVDTITAPEA